MGVLKYGNINDMPRGWISEEKWHHVIYDMWKDMWRRCYTHKNYFGCLIHPKFRYLSNFVDWIKVQPNFQDFYNSYLDISWSIDKDIKVSNNRLYYPEFMLLIPRKDNSLDAFKKHNNPSKVLKRFIIGIKKDEKILSKSLRSLDKYGFDHSYISKCCRKIHKTHKGYKWYYINYKHGKRLRRV